MAQQTTHELEVEVTTQDAKLAGSLGVPGNAAGLVLFAHGSGSSRFSGRNRFVAERLQDAGLATVLFDLLTAGEHEVDQFTREHRFNINLLSDRLTGAVDWARQFDDTRNLPLGLFGASTGAAAALVAAARRPDAVAAVVSRGGRPDLAGSALTQVRAPTLLIVGGHDSLVIQLNREAENRLNCEKRTEIVPGATHLFEEPGALEQVADLAAGWFKAHLTKQ